ncbi:MAG: T9SS type A sorting domain-containing protein [Bacteroidia bacterium]|nr:T9SS type A sorting domain-containing protein [Bacteroidia bacterium]
MRSLTLFFALIGLVIAPMSGQISILFVDDTDDTFGNASYFASALDSLGYTYTYYNAVDSTISPSDTYMAGFDLVIWHTSSDGSGLLFWNGLSEDNPALKAYLEGGGKLWVSGNDFLYNRYGAAPDTFVAGSFPYDYLGIKQYDFQSYGDDGNLGVPAAYPDTAQPITGLDTLTWQFSTLWWADGVSIRPEAVPIYRMGDASYIFADSITGVWYDADSFQTLSFFFDMALVANFTQLKNTTKSVVELFESLTTAIDKNQFAATNVSIYPNPTSGAFNLTFTLDKNTTVSGSLWNIQGQKVASLFSARQFTAGTHQLKWNDFQELPVGTYILRMETDGATIARPLVFMR